MPRRSFLRRVRPETEDMPVRTVSTRFSELKHMFNFRACSQRRHEVQIAIESDVPFQMLAVKLKRNRLDTAIAPR